MYDITIFKHKSGETVIILNDAAKILVLLTALSGTPFFINPINDNTFTIRFGRLYLSESTMKWLCDQFNKFDLTYTNF